MLHLSIVYGKHRVTGSIPKGPFCTPARTKKLYAYTSGDTRRELDLHRASRHMLQARRLRWSCWKHSRSKPRFRSRVWQVGKPKKCRDNPGKAFPPAFSKKSGCMDGWGTTRCPCLSVIALSQGQSLDCRSPMHDGQTAWDAQPRSVYVCTK